MNTKTHKNCRYNLIFHDNYVWHSLRCRWLDKDNCRNNISYPSPSSLMDVSARTLSASPTVVFSLQSIPSRAASSLWHTTTRYRVRPAWALSSFTACWHDKQIDFILSPLFMWQTKDSRCRLRCVISTVILISWFVRDCK